MIRLYTQSTWRVCNAVTFGTTANATASPQPDDVTGTPDNDDTWTQCSQCNTDADRRTLQASGPFLLTPGAVNELIIGVVWVPDQSYPCPSIRRLQEADDIAQALFDNCFEITDGPDAGAYYNPVSHKIQTN